MRTIESPGVVLAQFARDEGRVDGHPRCDIMDDPSPFVLQSQDAGFRPDGKTGAYGGDQPWLGHAGRFRSPGDGQVDVEGIFSRLTGHGYEGRAVLEWECCLETAEDGAREGARFISDQIAGVSTRASDDVVKSGADRRLNRIMIDAEESR